MQSLDVMLLHSCMALEREHASIKKFWTFLRASLSICWRVSYPEEISIAGEQALVALYNGKPGESIDSLCYKCFCEKLPQAHLISASPATYFSCCKNTIAFKLYSNIGMQRLWWWNNLLEQGCDEKLMPLHTDLPPAPSELLKIIRHDVCLWQFRRVRMY